MDRFAAALLNLASEVWVQEEKLSALSAQANPGDPAPDPEAKLQAFIDRVFAPLRESPGRP